MTTQQLQSLASQLQRVPNHDFTDYALSATNTFELRKLNWLNRIIRYFSPNRYSAIQHIPKLTTIVSQLFRENERAIDYATFTSNLEKLLFKEIRRVRSHEMQNSANRAIKSLITLQDQVIPLSIEQRHKAILSRIKALCKNLCDNPEEFFTLIRDIKPSELSAFIQSRQVQEHAKFLQEKLFRTLSGKEPLVGTVKIAPQDLVQPSNTKLHRWATSVPNYRDVCNTLNRRPLTAVMINGKTLDDIYVPCDEQKVPAVCDALLKQLKQLVPHLTEKELLPIVGEMVALIAIELPNPISLTTYLLFLHNILCEDRQLHLLGENLHDAKKPHLTISTEFCFNFTVESGSLHAVYTTQRGYTLAHLPRGAIEPIAIVDVIFTSRVQKLFKKYPTVWTAALTTTTH